MIRLERLRLYSVDLELRSPFRSSESTQRSKRTYLVELESDDGVTGWSEISAQEDPSYWPETVSSCLDVIEHHLVPRLGIALESPFDIARVFASIRGNQMARASIEMALFDLWAHREGVSLWQLLGAASDRTHITAGVSLSLADDIDGLREELAIYQQDGYRFFKAKIAPGADAAILELCGTEFALDHLVLDANGSYSGAHAGELDRLDSLGVALLEQPLTERDFAGLADTARRLRTPIGLDESVGGVDDIVTALRLGMRPTINLKPSRVGGYVESLKIIELCQHEGLHLRIGGMLETGIGRAHNLALASHPAFDRVGDLAASDRYFANDLTEPFVLTANGTIERPTGTGLGRVPDPAWISSTSCLELHIGRS
ncbi:o-succinylbenzoate synthase [Ferrimicrobium acidiphilum]|uniref:o-succinylbenzoate synthase n=1 Tax=Ferrimicrobium acidiphilum TaxID=121039 RepID=UPI0023F4BE4D|nr:o-succinylbenzoate synthase [Ferrimicrobium acidiphilum]